MDPQLEEYRRKQRERAGSQRAVAAQQNKSQSWSAFAVLGIVVVLAAVVYQQNIPNAAVGQSMPNAVAGVQGTCPKPTGVGICVEDCSHHDDCSSQGKLCCSNGCGHVCMDPEMPGAAQQSGGTGKCTLMVSLVGESAEAVMQVVPTPSNSNVLKAVGVIILEYKADRSHDCCAAKRTLDAKPDIAKSVEFDGPPPDCASQGKEEADEHMEIVEDGAEFIDPDWKEAQERSAGESEHIAGGWTQEKTAENNGLSDENLDMWDKVLEKYPTHEEYDLKKLGKPISAQTQVVAGTNYKFGFTNDAIVQVFHQPWSDTLEITDAHIPNSQD